MKSLKILILSSVFLFTNCSLINDKFFSKNKSKEQEVVKAPIKKSKEEELITERVYIEDEKEKEIIQEKEGLQGDIEFQNNTDYPNLADVPTRPDSGISFEEQDRIIKSIENNSQLKLVPSEPVIEDKVSNLEQVFNDSENDRNKKKYNSIRSYKDTKLSIREIQIAKLEEIKNFRPKLSYSKNQKPDEQEQELHNIARELKNIKTPEQINKVEEKIKKNDLYYTPQDIEKILGIKVSKNEKKENISEEVIANKRNVPDEQEVIESTIIEKKIEQMETPVARVTFNHGSSQITDEDMLKIKKVADLFYTNEGKKIVIVGHASSRTNYDMDLTKHALINFNISLERARKVMNGFSNVGLNSQKIELVAMSDTKPLYAEIMPSLEAANRRAEIFIQY